MVPRYKAVKYLLTLKDWTKAENRVLVLAGKGRQTAHWPTTKE